MLILIGKNEKFFKMRKVQESQYSDLNTICVTTIWIFSMVPYLLPSELLIFCTVGNV